MAQIADKVYRNAKIYFALGMGDEGFRAWCEERKAEDLGPVCQNRQPVPCTGSVP